MQLYILHVKIINNIIVSIHTDGVQTLLQLYGSDANRLNADIADYDKERLMNYYCQNKQVLDKI